MKQILLPMPEVGVLAATRGLLGAGVALLLADRIPSEKQRTIGWTLFMIGALSTLPLAIDVLSRARTPECEEADFQ